MKEGKVRLNDNTHTRNTPLRTHIAMHTNTHTLPLSSSLSLSIALTRASSEATSSTMCVGRGNRSAGQRYTALWGGGSVCKKEESECKCVTVRI